jgi:hypothetical protein
VKSAYSEEKSRREHFENLAQVEQALKALGEELDEEGHDLQYYISLFEKEAMADKEKS